MRHSGLQLRVQQQQLHDLQDNLEVAGLTHFIQELDQILADFDLNQSFSVVHFRVVIHNQVDYLHLLHEGRTPIDCRKDIHQLAFNEYRNNLLILLKQLDDQI